MTGSPPGRIFISYRRQDTAYPADWLYDRLVAAYGGQVFKDVDSTPHGHYVYTVAEAVGSSDVLLVLIGDQWITDQAGRRRLDDPSDQVCLEIEAALMRNVRVIPILVDDARMPGADELPPSLAGMAHRHALELSASRLDFNMRSMIKMLDETLGVGRGVGSRPLSAGPTVGHPSEDPSTPSRPTKPPNRQVYPLVEAPGVVVVEKPFDVTVGIAPRRDRKLIGTGGFAVTSDMVLEVVLAFDPGSLRVDGESRFTLVMTSTDPYPTRLLRFTALDGDELVRERRIGVHYLRDGAVVGIAWRLIVAVPTADDVAGTPVPPIRERELLDLSSVLIEDPPDLVLAVYRADTAAVGDYVWSAYPAAAGIVVPDHKRGENIGDPTEFSRSIDAEVARTGPGQGRALYDFLIGTGKRIGRKVPSAIQWAIRAVAERAGTRVAASVLLFTEDPYVPWELAVLSSPLNTELKNSPLLGMPLHTAWDNSPFLGAHVAIGRWPLTETRPRPIPRRSVEVVGRAVLTARYERVIRWPQLPEAEAEAASIATAYPGTVTIEPLYSKVMDCLRGDPEVDILHVALHGRFDPAGIDQGLVLLAPQDGGGYAAQYLKPQHVESVTMPRPTFVFLNACQVGAGQRVLGDYAGLAAAFLSAGASGVVAALWNVNDQVARAVAEQFYQALDADRVPVAELLRRIRAQYTWQIAEAQPDGRATTLLAYQLVGHPRLRLTTEPTDGVG
jgi:CHAT domain/TIR domain